MGLYGKGFTLNDPANNGCYAAADQPIAGGPYTREPGVWGYNEVKLIQPCFDCAFYPLSMFCRFAENLIKNHGPWLLIRTIKHHMLTEENNGLDTMTRVL